ncbi:hypothetical protein POM88_026307 [Heracleum sosnowskyi]|uniref:PWWP domain-containing protein n=1 Tax=Heracleum sosnowskyi TaxID=360622 RepID=A0AAD8MPV1_9APIA|nr:hypothetical protein POM88_026307 [Heracleum sosnowskyi]
MKLLLPEFSPHENKDLEEDIVDLPLAQWTGLRNKRKGISSLDTHVTVRSQNKSVEAQKTGTSALEFVPDKSSVSMCSDACLNQQRVVWAKRASHMWWPAECFNQRSSNPSEEFQEALKQVL